MRDCRSVEDVVCTLKPVNQTLLQSSRFAHALRLELESGLGYSRARQKVSILSPHVAVGEWVNVTGNT